MGTFLSPYLSFRNTAEAAMRFYQSVFGGELTLDTFESFRCSDASAEDSKIVHSMLVTGGGLVLMAADTPDGMDYVPGTNHSVVISSEDQDELWRYWKGLSGTGRIIVPLASDPGGGIFGTCIDRYGVAWIVSMRPAAPDAKPPWEPV
ncbi:PhnB protein [Arthrobacter sp. GAS37]|uniref:VOC family protein n=1 Tax=Arthrobacter sp. GAS37 TaxID=3156261 RepID=UPI003837458D